MQERLFRMNLANDPYCSYCIGLNGAASAICNFEHYFCSCVRVESAWVFTKSLLTKLMKMQLADMELVTLQFAKSENENEVRWLIGIYFNYVWATLYEEGDSMIDRGKWFGYLRFKYKNDQLGSRLPLCIPDLQ